MRPALTEGGLRQARPGFVCSGDRETGFDRGWPETGANRLRTPDPSQGVRSSGVRAFYFQAQVGCSKWATRVGRPWTTTPRIWERTAAGGAWMRDDSSGTWITG